MVADDLAPDVVGHEQHSPGGDEFGLVPVRTLEDSLASMLLSSANDASVALTPPPSKPRPRPLQR